MKRVFLLLSFVASLGYGQMTIKLAKDSLLKYHMSSYSYMEAFIDKPGYGAPIILTADGGAAAFGDGDEGTALLKLNKEGKKQWQKLIKKQFSEMEAQSVAQDTKGNYFVFMLSYDNKRYRGGSERVICYDKTGKLLWDKTLGAYTLLNNPVVSYLRTEKDGRIYMRGHVVTEQPAKDKDPNYHFWEGWIDVTGKLTQKSGEIIDWKKEEWQLKFKPE